MDNIIGNTVIFTKDLLSRFSAENVEQLKVFSLSKKAFDKCEYLVGDKNNQIYKIADFDVEISKDKARFFYGNPVQYGFYRNKPKELCFLPVGTCPTPKGFETIGTESIEEEYKVPGSMWDFAMFIDDFLFHVTERRLEMQNEFTITEFEKHEFVIAEPDNDLPF